MYTIGLDLGQSQDFTAVTILEKHIVEKQPVYHVRHCERLPLGTSYPNVVEHIKTLLNQQPLAGKELRLVVDATGCGRPVLDMIREKLPYQTIAGVNIHGGDSVTRDGWDYRVPKRNLVAVLQVLLQNKRLKIAASLPHAGLLTRELLNFKIKIDPLTAHDSYSAWREGVHDDLVLSVALTCWLAENVHPVDVWRKETVWNFLLG